VPISGAPDPGVGEAIPLAGPEGNGLEYPADREPAAV
jgi:catechol-2,3-dioxygenase